MNKCKCICLSEIPNDHNSWKLSLSVLLRYIFHVADAENLGNSTASLRIWQCFQLLPRICLLTLRGCSWLNSMSQRETDSTAALRLPVKWFSLLINTKSNQPLSSFPLWSFNTPQTRDRLQTHQWDQTLSPIYVSEPLSPVLRWRNIHFLRPSGPSKAQVLTETTMTESHFGHHWAKADSCRYASIYPMLRHD